MRRSLAGWMPSPALPAGYTWHAWDRRDLDIHAGVKYLSFANTIDAEVFVNLSSLTGCRMLMRAIEECDNFCPQATWLLTNTDGAVGTIQGVVDSTGLGWIQNVGVLPDVRRHGLGACLVIMALQGFRNAGAKSVFLEVTAGNPSAVRLYRRLGFKPYNTFYREIERRTCDYAGAGV
ncbi:GNAT family N-acetyltransferase [soil metagenome]